MKKEEGKTESQEQTEKVRGQSIKGDKALAEQQVKEKGRASDDTILEALAETIGRLY
jgi:hypothetical protein